MKELLPFILMFLVGAAFGQTTDLAAATRARNGKLISLTNIVGLRDCETKNFVGEVRKIEKDGRFTRFELWEPKETDNTLEIIKEKIRGRKPIKDKVKVEVNLARIAPADRAQLFRDMIRKSFTLRVAGYACAPSEVLSVFSMDLVY